MIGESTSARARVHHRIEVEWQATYQWPGESFRLGTILDASPCGVFLRAMSATQHIGKDVAVRLRPAGRDPKQSIDVEGTVRWAGFSMRHRCEGAGIRLRDGGPSLETYLPEGVCLEDYPGRTPSDGTLKGSHWVDGLWGTYELLLVTDDPEVETSLVSGTAEHPHLIARTVHSGREALAIVSSAPPDLMVVDMDLPDLDGRDVLSRLTRQGLTERPLVVMVSTRDNQEDRRLALELGAIEYELKPLHPVRLVRKLEFLLEKHVTE